MLFFFIHPVVRNDWTDIPSKKDINYSAFTEVLSQNSTLKRLEVLVTGPYPSISGDIGISKNKSLEYLEFENHWDEHQRDEDKIMNDILKTNITGGQFSCRR